MSMWFPRRIVRLVWPSSSTKSRSFTNAVSLNVDPGASIHTSVAWSVVCVDMCTDMLIDMCIDMSVDM